MAFDNVTFFEVHLDGAKISPSFGDDADAETGAEMDVEAMDEETAAETGAEESGRGRGRAVAVLALLAVAGVAAFRRCRGRAIEVDEEIEIESVDATESAEPVEQ
jgi:hypothetical protein